ncbi:DNA polymerase III subunit gamma/tau [Psittacicella gerlachiana]|uniref:DNA polymerase III subunit gamma/tau n=1 Tax=Psittacicella gerlachiana TaxID=2028574 RepID=A0A3A1YAV6_9GAMM|nr:DNA polymerase III subunit gamma/tau [Psittacicella gerlachiana]RIY34369.1 DNA polymerase III, subunit gamma and tau [Psittacicella gerlachiana]
MTENYTVLARKYRPKEFSQVVGQEHVLDAMRNSILNNKLHSVYLLSGTRGVGKTTIARIFTKAMNCENFAQKREPCGYCVSCKSIDDGASPDLLEVDAASRTKVEETRDLIESIQYAPLLSKYKVFIIDEVHMLTVSSFNALLKTLEEPPEYAKFILCTTDPQKIPATVLSRCLHFHLKPFTEEQIANQLKFVLNNEQIKFENKAVQALALAANGSMRDCLSLTDQAIAIGNQEVSSKSVYQMLGLVDDTLPTDLVIAILRGQKYEVLNILQKINREQVDWSSVVQQVLNIIYQASLLPFLSADEYQDHGINNDDLIAEFKRENFGIFDVEKTQVIYEVFTHALDMLKVTATPYQVVQLACIRALAFGIEQGNIAVLKFSQTTPNLSSNKVIKPSFKTTKINPYKKVNSTIDDLSEFSLTKNQQRFAKAESGVYGKEQVEKAMSGMVVYEDANANSDQKKSLSALPESIRNALVIRPPRKRKVVEEKAEGKVEDLPGIKDSLIPNLHDQGTVEETKEVQEVSLTSISSVPSSLATTEPQDSQAIVNEVKDFIPQDLINQLLANDQEQTSQVDAIKEKEIVKVNHLTMSSDEIAMLQEAVDLTIDPDEVKISLSKADNIKDVNLLGAYKTKEVFLKYAQEYIEKLYLSDNVVDALFAYCIKENHLLEKLFYGEWDFLSPETLHQETLITIAENQELQRIFALNLSKNLLLFVATQDCSLTDSNTPTFLIDLKGNQDLEEIFNREYRDLLLSSLNNQGVELTTIKSNDFKPFNIMQSIFNLVEQNIDMIHQEQIKTLSIFNN